MALTLVPVSAEEFAALTRKPSTRFDMSEYVAYIAPLPVDSWYKAELSNGDNPTVIRTRLRRAANEVGKDLSFKKTQTNDDGSHVMTFHISELDAQKVANRKLRAEKIRASRAEKAGRKLVAV